MLPDVNVWMRWVEYHQLLRRREQPDPPHRLAASFIRQATYEKRGEICLVSSERLLQTAQHELLRQGTVDQAAARSTYMLAKTALNDNGGICLSEVKHLPDIDEDVEDQLVYSAAVQGRAQIILTFDRRFREAVADYPSSPVLAMFPKQAMQRLGFALPVSGGASSGPTVQPAPQRSAAQWAQQSRRRPDYQAVQQGPGPRPLLGRSANRELGS